MRLTKATTKNMNEFDNSLPSFDCFIWPIIQFMKSKGEESTKLQIVDSLETSRYLNLPDRKLSAGEKKELRYRAERAFDLLLVAEIIEEKMGNMYGLTNGAFLLTEDEACNLPKRVRTLDSYFEHNENEETLLDDSQVIASQYIEALEKDSLNEYELKEKLVKDFASRNEVKKNLTVVDHYVDKVDYVKKVLESKEIVEEDEVGNIELCKEPEDAQKMLDKHYSQSIWHQIKSSFVKLTERLRERKLESTKKYLTKNILLELGLFASVVGISWIIVSGQKRRKR